MRYHLKLLTLRHLQVGPPQSNAHQRAEHSLLCERVEQTGLKMDFENECSMEHLGARDSVDWDMSIFDDLLHLLPVEADSNQLSCQTEQCRKNSSDTQVVVKTTSRRMKKKGTGRPVRVIAAAKAPFKLKLYAFPSFDKSDSLIYLPSTMARLSNCGDVQKFAKLMKNYCTKDCAVCFDQDFEHPLPLLMYLELVEVGDVLYPDNLMCVHTTSVIDNQIQATLYYKYTDVPEMYSYVRTIPGVSDSPVCCAAFVGDRKELLVRNFQLHKRPELVKDRMCALFDKNEPFEMYGKEHVTFTFNPHNKKIVRWHTENTLTYARHDGVQYDL